MPFPHPRSVRPFRAKHTTPVLNNKGHGCCGVKQNLVNHHDESRSGGPVSNPTTQTSTRFLRSLEGPPRL